uniref:Uncharacterized protein n=1 Tax=Anguilla anguilla TaxID=7936 RepID=A0A0E9T4I3_ANGAN
MIQTILLINLRGERENEKRVCLGDV